MTRKIKTVFFVPTVALSKSRCVLFIFRYAFVLWRKKKAKPVHYEIDESYIEKIKRENYV